jgi:hypothetical protein
VHKICMCAVKREENVQLWTTETTSNENIMIGS